MRKKIGIFCGAREGNSPEIITQIRMLCRLLTAQEYDLVYGGGKTGLMGIVADEFLRANCEVIGVRPSKLIADEDAHEGISQLIVVETMAERKQKMTDLSDLFLALPGGLGTLDEIVETFTLHKIGFIDKISIILNLEGFFDGLLMLLDQMQERKFLSAESRDKLVIANSVNELVDVLDKIKAPSNPLTIIDKVAFIEIKNGKILVSRSYGKKKFYIPGGKRDLGESDEETLIREVAEELSIDIFPGSPKYLGTFEAQADGKAPGTIVRMTCYSAEYSGFPKASNEIEEIDWFNHAQIEMVSYVDEIIFDFLKEKGDLI